MRRSRVLLAGVALLHLAPLISLWAVAPRLWVAAGSVFLGVSWWRAWRASAVAPGCRLALTNGLSLVVGDQAWPVATATVASRALWITWQEHDERDRALMLLRDSFFHPEDWRMARVAARHAVLAS